MKTELITCEVCGREFDFASKGYICPHCDYNNNPASQWPTGKIKTLNELSIIRCSNCCQYYKHSSNTKCPQCDFIEHINILGENTNG